MLLAAFAASQRFSVIKLCFTDLTYTDTWFRVPAPDFALDQVEHMGCVEA